MGATLHRGAGTALHRGARAPHHRGPSRCGAQAPDAQAQQLWLTGPGAPRHVGSSQTRARTRVPCISRQTLNHRATGEAQFPLFLCFVSLFRFLLCGYHEVCIKHLIDKIVLFLLIASCLHFPIQVPSFSSSPFMFLLSQIIPFYVVDSSPI